MLAPDQARALDNIVVVLFENRSLDNDATCPTSSVPIRRFGHAAQRGCPDNPLVRAGSLAERAGIEPATSGLQGASGTHE